MKLNSHILSVKLIWRYRYIQSDPDLKCRNLNNFGLPGNTLLSSRYIRINEQLRRDSPDFKFNFFARYFLIDLANNLEFSNWHHRKSGKALFPVSGFSNTWVLLWSVCCVFLSRCGIGVVQVCAWAAGTCHWMLNCFTRYSNRYMFPPTGLAPKWKSIVEKCFLKLQLTKSFFGIRKHLQGEAALLF